MRFVCVSPDIMSLSKSVRRRQNTRKYNNSIINSIRGIMRSIIRSHDDKDMLNWLNLKWARQIDCILADCWGIPREAKQRTGQLN